MFMPAAVGLPVTISVKQGSVYAKAPCLQSFVELAVTNSTRSWFLTPPSSHNAAAYASLQKPSVSEVGLGMRMAYLRGSRTWQYTTAA